MTRQPMTTRAELISSIHGLPAGTRVTVLELNKHKPCVVSYEGTEYKVMYSNLDILDL